MKLKKIRKNIKALRQLKGKVRKSKIFGFDIETYANNKKFLCASIVGDNYIKFFLTIDAVKKEIASNPIFRNSYICATNLMFDFFGLFTVRDAFKDFHVIERSSSVILASSHCLYENSKRNFYSRPRLKGMVKRKIIKSMTDASYPITFIDTANHLKTSVAVLGKIIGLDKLTAPDCLGHKPKTKKEWEYMKLYNIRDSEVTYKFMIFLQTQYNIMGCNIKPTVSSTTMDLFRRQYLNTTWKQEDRKKINFCYKAYYGGRTEAFERGIFSEENYNKINVYDVNSLYPTCLRDYKFPLTNDSYFKKKISLDDVDNYNGVGFFNVKTPNDLHIPILPVKTDKLRFPVGKFSGYYDFNSIRLALNHGYQIEETGKGLIYEHTHKPFKHFVNNLYKKRMEFKKQKSKVEIVIKLLLNSFYGKFGYRYGNKEFLGTADAVINAPKTAEILPTSDNSIFRIRTTEESKIPAYVFPIYPLYVTSYAREVMFRHFRKTGIKNILYTDTDCLFTTKKINTSEKLGDLKLEAQFKDLTIIKPKFYSGLTIDGKDIIKVKGIHKAIKDYNHFRDMTQQNSFNLKMLQFRKLRGSLGNSKRWINQTYNIVKSMSLNDDKRIWDKDIFTVNPQKSRPVKL